MKTEIKNSIEALIASALRGTPNPTPEQGRAAAWEILKEIHAEYGPGTTEPITPEIYGWNVNVEERISPEEVEHDAYLHIPSGRVLVFEYSEEAEDAILHNSYTKEEYEETVGSGFFHFQDTKHHWMRGQTAAQGLENAARHREEQEATGCRAFTDEETDAVAAATIARENAEKENDLENFGPDPVDYEVQERKIDEDEAWDHRYDPTWVFPGMICGDAHDEPAPDDEDEDGPSEVVVGIEPGGGYIYG